MWWCTLAFSATQKIAVQGQSQQKHETLSEKKWKQKDRGMAQVVEHLPSKLNALSSVCSTVKKIFSNQSET
jgi:hypothetical protein